MRVWRVLHFVTLHCFCEIFRNIIKLSKICNNNHFRFLEPGPLNPDALTILPQFLAVTITVLKCSACFDWSIAGVYPLRYPVVHDVAPPSPILLPSAIGTAMDIGIKVVGARNKFGLVPKKDSLVNGKENLIADAGLMMGRSFRVGWGPGFVLVHSGTPLGKQQTKPASTTQPSMTGDFLTALRPSSSEGSPPFGVTLEKLHVASHYNQGRSDTVLVGSFHSICCHSIFSPCIWCIHTVQLKGKLPPSQARYVSFLARRFSFLARRFSFLSIRFSFLAKTCQPSKNC